MILLWWIRRRRREREEQEAIAMTNAEMKRAGNEEAESMTDEVEGTASEFPSD
jgi:hypothetical protein